MSKYLLSSDIKSLAAGREFRTPIMKTQFSLMAIQTLKLYKDAILRNIYSGALDFYLVMMNIAD